MSGANKDMFLWWGSGSPPCWKAMIVLAEKGLWDKKMNRQLQFDKKEHKSEEVLKINPRGQLPTFKDGDVVVNDSSAICMYLEEKYSKDSNRLLPEDSAKRADVYQRMFEVNNIQSNIFQKLIASRRSGDSPDQKTLDDNIKTAQEEIGRWADILGQKKYLCGDTFTMADVFFFPLLALLVRMGATLAKQPLLKAYYDSVSTRPSVKETGPKYSQGRFVINTFFERLLKTRKRDFSSFSRS